MSFSDLYSYISHVVCSFSHLGRREWAAIPAFSHPIYPSAFAPAWPLNPFWPYYIDPARRGPGLSFFARSSGARLWGPLCRTRAGRARAFGFLICNFVIYDWRGGTPGLRSAERSDSAQALMRQGLRDACPQLFVFLGQSAAEVRRLRDVIGATVRGRGQNWIHHGCTGSHDRYDVVGWQALRPAPDGFDASHGMWRQEHCRTMDKADHAEGQRMAGGEELG
jgi:hypothetical protein